MKTNTSKFNIFAVPKAKNLVLALVLVAAGLGLIFGLPRVVPARTGSTPCPIESVKAPFVGVSLDAVARSLRAFELDNELDGGLFRTTSNAGDSLPSDEVTHMALLAGRRLSSLPYSELYPVEHGESRLESHIAKLLPHALSGELPLHRTYFLISIAQSLNHPIPAENGVAARIASLAHPSGGYRLNEYARHATVGATYYALKTLEALGQLESAHVPSEQVASYVYSLQDPATGGVRDSEYAASAAPLMDDVYRAAEVLRLAKANLSAPAAQAAAAGFRAYLAQCRGADGGFGREPGATPKAAPTAMGLLVAALAEAAGAPLKGAVRAGALDYLAACVSNKRGVAETPLAAKPSAEGAFYLTELMARAGDAAQVPLGRRSWVLGAAQWAAALLFAAAAAAWVAPQLEGEGQVVARTARTAALLLVALAAPAAAALVCPSAALAAYGTFAAVALAPLACRAVAAQKEGEKGDVALVAGVAALVFAAFVVGFAAKAPFVFAGAGVAGLAGVWGFGAAYAAAYCAGFVFVGKSAKFYADAADLAWVCGVAVAGLSLFATESPVYEMLVTRGLFAPFVVVAPVVVFVMFQLGMAIGNASFSCAPETRKSIKKFLKNFM